MPIENPVPLEYATGARPPSEAELAAASRRRRRRSVGAVRQAVFAAGLATTAFGLGASIASRWDDDGPYWMLLGGALVGLSTPFRRGDRI